MVWITCSVCASVSHLPLKHKDLDTMDLQVLPSIMHEDHRRQQRHFTNPVASFSLVEKVTAHSPFTLTTSQVTPYIPTNSAFSQQSMVEFGTISKTNS